MGMGHEGCSECPKCARAAKIQGSGLRGKADWCQFGRRFRARTRHSGRYSKMVDFLINKELRKERPLRLRSLGGTNQTSLWKKRSEKSVQFYQQTFRLGLASNYALTESCNCSWRGMAGLHRNSY